MQGQSPAVDSKTFHIIKRWLQLFFLLVTLFFIFQYIQHQWDQVKYESLYINAPKLILAQVIVTTGLGLQSWASWFIVRELGAACSRVKIWEAFFLAQLAKYLPGGIWALPSRAFFYHQQGLSKARSIEALFWESGLSVIGASLVAILGFPLFSGTSYRIVVVGLLGGFCVCFLVSIAVWRYFGPTLQQKRLFKHVFLRSWMGPELHVTFPKMVLLIIFYAADWCLIGIGFAELIQGLGGDLHLESWANLMGLFAGAWAVGFLIIFSPGGVGIREGLLIIGIAHLINDPLPLVAAVLARIGWIIAEIVNLVLSKLFVHVA